MDENANTDRSPFRKFPWVQLAFCLACLTMTAWTWIRYSYAWDVTPDDLWLKMDGTERPPHSFWIKSSDQSLWYWGNYESNDIYAKVAGQVFLLQDSTIVIRLSGPSEPKFRDVWSPDTEWPGPEQHTLLGRLSWTPDIWTLHTTASRFHGASIAGIVVGAMGVFIFGLYLRRWVKERRAGG